MIQLSGIQINSMNQSGKMIVKDGEQAAGFEALLQLMGQVQGQQEVQEEQETEPFGIMNPFVQPSILVQNVIPGSVLEPEGIEKLSLLVQTQVQQTQVEQTKVEPNIEMMVKQTADNPLFQSTVKNLVTVDRQAGKMPPVEATLILEPVAGEMVNETDIVTQKVITSEEFKQKELPDLNQPVKNSLAESFTMAHSAPTNQPIISSEKVIPTTQTIHADQFDQEITKFLQTSINVTGLEDGLEATFTLMPKHLGKIDVKVTIQDGQVAAEFLTSTPMGKELLETHVQALRSALETQGLQVGKLDISQQITNTNFMGTFSQKGDSQARQGQQDSRKRSEPVHLQTQDEYRDYITDTGWVSQINTTV
ncbi:flagellar hook-length control protein FliK [Neobacillus niacini]|uniref:flagellar hook-length control protein FliK n=1 Tax=Neobacillus niacini TaxID=86668 RepID=UPI002FFDA05C